MASSESFSWPAKSRFLMTCSLHFHRKDITWRTILTGVKRERRRNSLFYFLSLHHLLPSSFFPSSFSFSWYLLFSFSQRSSIWLTAFWGFQTWFLDAKWSHLQLPRRGVGGVAVFWRVMCFCWTRKLVHHKFVAVKTFR